MQLADIIDARHAVVGCLLVCVLCVLGLVRRTANRCEAAFLASMAAGLRHNFIVANPRTLFLVTVAFAVLLGAVGYMVAGPLGSAVAAVISATLPRWAVSSLRRRRIRRFVYQLPDALLALASALRAGSNLPKGLELLATRQAAPLSQEFTLVLAEYRVGRPLEAALADLRRRIDAQELDLMSAAINVSRCVGGNLGDTLEALARTLQEKAHMEGRIDALT